MNRKWSFLKNRTLPSLLQKWSFFTFIFPLHFQFFQTPLRQLIFSSDHHQRRHTHHHSSVTTCRHHSYGPSRTCKNCEWVRMAANGPFQMPRKPKRRTDDGCPNVVWALGMFFFWFVSSFYDLTWYPWSSFFLGSILPVTTGVEVAQPTPTASHPSPHPNGMRGFSVMLRRAGRGTRRPVEGTVGDSSGKHQKITLLLPRHSYMAANPVQNIDPAVSSPTSQQWPKSPNDNPSQPHEQLLVGCIAGGTTTVPLHNSGNNEGRQPTHHPPPASRATACGVIVGGMMLPPTRYPGLWAIAHRVQMGRVGDSVVTGRPFFCRYFVSSI